MKHPKQIAIYGLFLALFSMPLAAAEPASGWRGNATGLWPDTKAPTSWKRLAHGAIEDMRAQADQPSKPGAGKAPAVRKGLIAEWLVLGPFSVHDSVENFDDDLVGGEALLSPTSGQRSGGKEWRRVAGTLDDPMVFGTAVLPWVELEPVDSFAGNRIYYAHAHVYSPRGGPTRAVVEHCYGLKVWVNGRVAYRNPQRLGVLGGYQPISKHELANTEPPAGQFGFDLAPGWNRLLLKLSSSNRDNWKETNFCLRLMDPPDVAYESENIRWMTELPGRSTSTPILVGDRIFIAAEPDLLVCVDKRSGRILWSAANNYYEALSDEERQADPAYATRVAPLAAKLREEPDRSKRMALRREMQETLMTIDQPRFELKYDGHFASHFGIVGFSMPTPVSDGKHVYVWSGMGVAACYDLDGRRQWITRVPTGRLEYGSSPALADGVLGVFLGKLHGLDAKTGELLWTQPKIKKNIGAVLATTFAGRQVFVSQLGEIIRPEDGELLFRPRNAIDGGCWAPPVLLGSRMFVGKYGVKQLSVFDFKGVDPEEDLQEWKPELLATIDLDLPREHSLLPDGSWIDRSTAGSPLVHEDLAYSVDIYGWLYVRDLKTGATIYYKDLQLDGLMHYNAVPVAASPTLIGDKILVMDNQGTTIVLAPGRTFKVLGRNRIETRLERVWLLPAQETLTYAPPIADADCLYLRGERFLYCIGQP
ncbi:MAG: outer membrane protein assembly factor BamB [Pseudoalteromonas tetraodonis]|jgi:outer membrane protein assembly factor BamB